MNTFTYRATIILAGCCLLCLSGCASTPIVDYAVRNCTGRELNRVNIAIGSEFSDSMGVLIPDAHKGYGGPVPVSRMNAVEIAWENPDGKMASGHVEVSRSQMRDPRQLFFDIQRDGRITLAWRFDKRGNAIIYNKTIEVKND